MLELKNISYFYKSQKDKMVLDQISYQFEKGKMYAILGTSGSGNPMVELWKQNTEFYLLVLKYSEESANTKQQA